MCMFKHRQNTVQYCTTVDCTILIDTVYRKFLRHFRKHFRIPYEILELVQLAKHRKWLSLAARDGRGMEAVSTCSAEGQSKLLLILQKMRCVCSSTDRTPYCTVLQ